MYKTLSDGRITVRCVHRKQPGLRVTIGTYTTIEAARAAYKLYIETGETQRVTSFNNIAKRNCGWFALCDGKWIGPFKHDYQAAWQCRRAVDNKTQRQARANNEWGSRLPVNGKSRLPSARRATRRTSRSNAGTRVRDADFVDNQSNDDESPKPTIEEACKRAKKQRFEEVQTSSANSSAVFGSVADGDLLYNLPAMAHCDSFFGI